MTVDEIREKFSRIKTWKSGGVRAPHKPLLLLYALGHLHKRWLSWEDVKEEVGLLLEEFGPPRKTTPLYPFHYLANDGLWTFSPAGVVDPHRPLESVLNSKQVAGGFTDEVYDVLAHAQELVWELAEDLLYEHFPESLHGDILRAVGLNYRLVRRADRDPAFRQSVLRAYGYSCAICGFDVKLGGIPLALEAAHIKWYQAGGPDEVCNGLALCAMHHKLFDSGALGIQNVRGVYVVRVAEKANGTCGFEEWLLRYHDQNIRPPQGQAYPEIAYTQWHLHEVFKGSSLSI